MIRVRNLALALVFGAVMMALVSACSESSEPLVTNDVVTGIPWGQTEVATYRVTQNDIEGECVLTIEEDGGDVTLSQACEGAGFTDSVSVDADAETLAPVSTERTITGPEGEVNCRAEYGEAGVNVRWVSPGDERENDLAVPRPAYDSWGDLFLWRTVRFGQGYDQNYVDVATCTNPRARPELVGVRLTATGIETVEAPYGTFETWRLRVRSEGHTQDVWYSSDEERLLVKYDNGEQVFELVSLER